MAEAVCGRWGIRGAGRLYRKVLKPATDRGVALIALVLLMPVLAVVALVIRFSLGSGVLFRQRRVGLGGREFTVYKFRTMAPGAEVDEDDVGHPPCSGCLLVCHKCPNDPRHTRVGRSLRRRGLDELPQLLNVLKGEMSLVGPRPELPKIVARYEPWQHDRHQVKPGLTGLWQISERGNGTAMHEATKVDLEYVERLSLRTDLGILLRTVPVVFWRRTGS